MNSPPVAAPGLMELLDKDKFLLEYKTGGSKINLLTFMESRINQRYEQGETSKSTWKTTARHENGNK